jgi:membrane complex biogenesis BtpA family protein
MRSWLDDVFKTKKPIIAMCHLMALPGDPHYDSSAGMQAVIDWARKDVAALQSGGVDGIMFSNEFSMPYLTEVPAVTVASMARIIGEVKKELELPFGVNVLWDPKASLDLAAATDAVFLREVFSGVYASDFGLWNPNCGEIIRHQHAISAENVKLIFNILPEAAKYLADRDIVEIARSTVFNHQPDAICVSGLTAGVQTDSSVLFRVKEALPDTPVLVNTGVRLENVDEQLEIADGAVVGTTFKYEAIFNNHVDERRVIEFMERVSSLREA